MDWTLPCKVRATSRQFLPSSSLAGTQVCCSPLPQQYREVTQRRHHPSSFCTQWQLSTSTSTSLTRSSTRRLSRPSSEYEGIPLIGLMCPSSAPPLHLPAPPPLPAIQVSQDQQGVQGAAVPCPSRLGGEDQQRAGTVSAVQCGCDLCVLPCVLWCAPAQGKDCGVWVCRRVGVSVWRVWCLLQVPGGHGCLGQAPPDDPPAQGRLQSRRVAGHYKNKGEPDGFCCEIVQETSFVFTTLQHSRYTGVLQ